MLTLDLARVPGVLGIYGKSGDVFPERMSLLHPTAAKAFAELEAALGCKVRVSDMFRTAEQSFTAMQQKTGVQPPAYSLHNYGIAIDIATDAVLKATGFDKPKLDMFFSRFGWWCHRKDGKRGMEDWHFNHLGAPTDAAAFLAVSAKSTNTSAAGEARIQSLYGSALRVSDVQAQTALSALKLYGGDIDGAFGTRSREALKAFQRTWKLQATGDLDERTQRVLAYVTATVRSQPSTQAPSV